MLSGITNVVSHCCIPFNSLYFGGTYISLLYFLLTYFNQKYVLWIPSSLKYTLLNRMTYLSINSQKYPFPLLRKPISCKYLRIKRKKISTLSEIRAVCWLCKVVFFAFKKKKALKLNITFLTKKISNCFFWGEHLFRSLSSFLKHSWISVYCGEGKKINGSR